MKAQTFENLVADQTDRIERCHAPAGSNLILDWINDFNDELRANDK